MKKDFPSKTICAHDGDKEAHLVLYYGAWLPLELNARYAAAIDELRAQGRRIAQSTNFCGNGGLGTVRRLFSRALNLAVEHGVTDIVTIIAPAHARIYTRWHFADMLPDEPQPRVWDLARDADGDFLPTRLIRLDITALDAATLAEWRAVQSADSHFSG